MDTRAVLRFSSTIPAYNEQGYLLVLLEKIKGRDRVCESRGWQQRD